MRIPVDGSAGIPARREREGNGCFKSPYLALPGMNMRQTMPVRNPSAALYEFLFFFGVVDGRVVPEAPPVLRGVRPPWADL